MSINCDASNVSRRQFLAAAGSVAAASSFALGKDSGSAQSTPSPPPIPPPVVHNVTIDVTKKPISYSVGNPAANAYHLQVNPNEVVTWTAVTSSPNPKHCVAIFFQKETPLADTNIRPVRTLLWSERDETPNGPPVTIDPDASGIYEYSVAVLDEGTQTTYTDDPRIIVGTGNFEARTTITSALDELRKAAEVAERKREPELGKQIESVEKKLERAIDELK